MTIYSNKTITHKRGEDALELAMYNEIIEGGLYGAMRYGLDYDEDTFPDVPEDDYGNEEESLAAIPPQSKSHRWLYRM